MWAAIKPSPSGDANLSLAIGEEVLRELAPRSLMQARAPLAFRPQRLGIDARAQALDDNAIKMTLGGKTVEVCCEECATKLKEANSAAASKA